MPARQLLSLAVASAAAVSPVAAAAAAAGQPPVIAGGCHVQAQVTASPGLTLQARDFSFSYVGTLDTCFYSGPNPVSRGAITAGRTIRIRGRDYREPMPHGNGSCQDATTSGYDFTRWADGTQTIVHFFSTSYLGATHIVGAVVPELRLHAVKGRGTALFETTRFDGQLVTGVVAFGTDDPAACQSKGLTNPTISGLLTHFV
jgi:hypothetical protein